MPGSTLVLSPELHLTILGYNGVVDYGTVQVRKKVLILDRNTVVAVCTKAKEYGALNVAEDT